MSLRPLVLFASAASFLSPPAFAQSGPFQGHKVVRVVPRSASELQAVSALSTNVWTCRPGVGPLEVQVTPEQRAALQSLGLECDVMIDDVQALVDAEAAQIREARLNRDAAWFSTYRSLPEIETRMDELVADSSGNAQTFTIGTSIEGRQIRGLRFSAPDEPGNPRDARPAVLFAGGIHAREWVSPMTVMYLADRMLETAATDAAVGELLREIEVIIIPVQNVDGYAFTWADSANRLWRKNRRVNADGSIGVDMNRNFAVGWGAPGASDDPNSNIFRGLSAFSEPETQAFRNFVIANPHIAAHVDYHSYSQLVLTPWGYSADPSPDAALWDRIDDSLVAAIESAFGSDYVGGPTYTTIYPASGTTQDWSYGARNILGLGIELRDRGQTGFLLPADQILPTAQENYLGALALIDFVRMPLLLSTNDRVAVVSDSSTTPVSLMVRPARSTLAPGGAALRFRVGDTGPFETIMMSQTSAATWTAQLPPVQCGLEAQWYFQAIAANGESELLPPGAPATLFSAPSQSVVIGFADEMETDTGWIVGGPDDSASRGIWERVDPEPTPAQPGDDTTVNGSLCWVTDGRAGPNIGSFDVDGGITTLTSPPFSTLPPPGFSGEAWITFDVWYSNNQGSAPNADSMPVELSTDGGTTWLPALDISENRGVWWRTRIPIAAPSAQTRVRFIARDLEAGSIVEAAVDELRVEFRGCRTGDFNQDGGIDGDDIIAFFSAWETGQPAADYTLDGGVDGDDVVFFFNLWDSGR